MRPLERTVIVVAIACAVVASARATAVRPSPAPFTQTAAAARKTPNELDAFMERVLEGRSVVQKTLNDYILDETETFDVLGPGRVRLYRSRREYVWYVRNGVHVRSPLKYDGVTIADDERRRYEERWFDREVRRRAREADRRAGSRNQGPPLPDDPIEEKPSTPQAPEPRFVSDAYFLEFKFEPGNYFLAGRERLENNDVLRIEYYPQRLFDDGPEDGGVKGGRDEPKDAEISRKMNKTSLVTLWVDPAKHQIVKYTFDNVWLDFLPAAWLVRVDDLRASMVMGEPFRGVWLPRGISIRAGATLANGSYDVTYARDFSNYRQADVTTNIRIKPPGDR
jgi:hypothetical protein